MDRAKKKGPAGASPFTFSGEKFEAANGWRTLPDTP